MLFVRTAVADYSIEGAYGIGRLGTPETIGTFGPDYSGGAMPISHYQDYVFAGRPGYLRGTISVSATQGNFGVTTTFESTSAFAEFEAFGDLTVSDSFRLVWNGEGTPTPTPAAEFKLIYGLTGTIETSLFPPSSSLASPSVEAAVHITVGGRQDSFHKYTSRVSTYETPIPPTIAFTVKQDSEGNYPYVVDLHWHVVSKSGQGAIRFGDGITLQRIEFPSGVTPESLDYSMVFDSEMESPNTRNLSHVGDFNRDGQTDGQDFLIWQRHAGLEFRAHPSQGDANNDGNVDGSDLAAWLQASQSPVEALPSGTSVPEPQACMLIGIGLLALLKKRRQS
jgi:hypothetical protein